MAKRPDTAQIRTPQGFVCLCIIGPAHGVRGAVKVKSFAEDPQSLTAYGALQDADGTPFEITSVKPDKMGARLTLRGIGDRNAAEALRGTALFVARDKLPTLEDADDFYHADLIGIEVFSSDGAPLGAVAGVHNFGAGDMLEINMAAAKAGKAGSAFYPFTKAVVPDIDIRAGRLTLVPPQENEARAPENSEADE